MKNRRPVVVLDPDLSPGAWKEVFHMGRERGWFLLDLRLSGMEVPIGVHPVAAFVNKLPDTPLVKKLLAVGCHVIRLGTAPHHKDPLVPAVLPDLFQVGARATEHYVDRGFEHLACIGHNPWGMYRPIFDGFGARAAELGATCHVFQWTSVLNEDGSRSTGREYQRRLKMFKKWMHAVPKPIGLLGFGDLNASFYNRMCIDAGLEVPAEVAILGIGNDETICETLYPSMSSVDVDYRTIVERAVEIVDQLSSGQTPKETTVLVPPKGVVVRQSTDVYAAKTPGVAKAISFMMDHYAEPIGIKDIARASGMSRSRLFVAFDKDQGQSPGIILTRIRIEKAQHMLRETDAKVVTIAEACGFGSSINMYHHFKQQAGMSPNAYRREQVK